MSKFVIRRVASGVKFDLKAANGQVIATSESYRTRAACDKGIASVQKNAPAAAVEDQTEDGYAVRSNPKFELYSDRSGKFRFRLKARNGKVVAVSESYTTRAGCEKGIESVRVNAADAETEQEQLRTEPCPEIKTIR